MTSTTFADLTARVETIAGRFRDGRLERQTRRHLERSDFDALRDAGWLRAAVPIEQGGAWEGVAASTRPLCRVLRTLARGDASVALVAAMHPAVLAYWLATPDGEPGAWAAQRRAVFATAAAGHAWGTITSEPGSGGDLLRTRTAATRLEGRHAEIPGVCYALRGDKHFGSGFGISEFMFTTGLVEGEAAPAMFAMDLRDVHAGRSDAVRVTATWDGAGMIATQSHAARLENMPAIRLAYEGPIDELMTNAGGPVMTMFAAVILGVFDEAVEFARNELARRRDSARAFEQVEWSRAELEHWLAEQAYEGALHAMETGDARARYRTALRAKTAIAELAEQSLRRITTVLGGGTYSRRSPLASWYEDVRALGFLRPPWGLAFDGLFASSFEMGGTRR